MNQEVFAKLEKYMKIVDSKYTQAISYFQIHDSLKKSRAPNIIGQEHAQQNLKVMNKYKHILGQPLEVGMMNLAIIELYKIFEKDDDCITLHKIINYIQTNIKYINKEIINNFKKRGITGHGEITNNFLLELKCDVEKISEKIEKLKGSRDNRSHSLKKLKQEGLNYTDIEEVHNIFNKIYNSLTIKTHSSQTDYSFLTENIQRDFNYLLKSLKKYDGINLILLKFFMKEKHSKINNSHEQKSLINALREYY